MSMTSWPPRQARIVDYRPARAASQRRRPDPPSMPTADAVEVPIA